VGVGNTDWSGMAVHGPLATTVEDAALLLSVLAGQPEMASVGEPAPGLRIAVAVRPPAQGVRVARPVVRAVFELAGVLRRAGFTVDRAEPAYPRSATVAGVARWANAAAEDVDLLPAGHRADPQRRTLRHAALGRRLRRRVRAEDAEVWQRAAEAFLEGRDLVLMPTTARAPLPALEWSQRSWRANVTASLRYSGGFTGVWNLAGWPALSLPIGIDRETGTPIGGQLVGRPGDEPLLFAVGALVERLRPWPRVFGAR